MVELNSENALVTDFYAGKSIFVTGGTGFIGKVLLEKLLYSCNDIDKIYILLRSNGSSSSEQRLHELINQPIFDRLKKVSPRSLEKIVNVAGDISKKNLGLNADAENSFIDKVSVVFHSAASIRFDERIDQAVNNNYEATKRVLNLCHRMKNIKSFVYMSTAFISPQVSHLEEVKYPPPRDSKELQAFIEQGRMDDKVELDKFIGGRPNTYTFTKALADSYVSYNHGSIPTAIIRPSIVTAAISEPTPGWIDAWSGVTAVIAPTCLGFNRVLVGNGNNKIDLIPVDYVTNLSIVAAAKNRMNNLEIFNICTTACNPINFKDSLKICLEHTKKNRHNVAPFPFLIMMEEGFIKEITVLMLEKLPALVADLWMRMKGEEPRYVKIHSKISAIREILKYFTSRSFTISADRTIALSRSLSKKDAILFPFNPKDVNWKQYIPIYCSGIRKYLLRK